MEANQAVNKGFCFDYSGDTLVVSLFDITDVSLAGEEIDPMPVPGERRCVYLDPWGILRTYPCPVIKPKPADK